MHIWYGARSSVADLKQESRIQQIHFGLLPSRRSARRRTLRDVSDVDRAPKRVQHAVEITHAARARAEFTERGCDKNSFSQNRSDCACSRCLDGVLVASGRTSDSSILRKTHSRVRERGGGRVKREIERVSRKLFADRVIAFRRPAILFVLFDLFRSPLRRKFELGNSHRRRP